ncbi:transposase [Sclerotinia borealis F-4128]|uniref:Transposase n=1 Tax=Sclerotinia borealis (strain F-4128) TaxID=1432307 RepID=W9CDQ2_SCLBF|nr:transposase [Sclerotinia borealis F-4128]
MNRLLLENSNQKVLVPNPASDDDPQFQWNIGVSVITWRILQKAMDLQLYASTMTQEKEPDLATRHLLFRYDIKSTRANSYQQLFSSHICIWRYDIRNTLQLQDTEGITAYGDSLKTVSEQYNFFNNLAGTSLEASNYHENIAEISMDRIVTKCLYESIDITEAKHRVIEKDKLAKVASIKIQRKRDNAQATSKLKHYINADWDEVDKNLKNKYLPTSYNSDISFLHNLGLHKDNLGMLSIWDGSGFIEHGGEIDKDDSTPLSTITGLEASSTSNSVDLPCASGNEDLLSSEIPASDHEDTENLDKEPLSLSGVIFDHDIPSKIPMIPWNTQNIALMDSMFTRRKMMNKEHKSRRIKSRVLINASADESGDDPDDRSNDRPDENESVDAIGSLQHELCNCPKLSSTSIPASWYRLVDQGFVAKHVGWLDMIQLVQVLLDFEEARLCHFHIKQLAKLTFSFLALYPITPTNHYLLGIIWPGFTIMIFTKLLSKIKPIQWVDIKPQAALIANGSVLRYQCPKTEECTIVSIGYAGLMDNGVTLDNNMEYEKVRSSHQNLIPIYEYKDLDEFGLHYSPSFSFNVDILLDNPVSQAFTGTRSWNSAAVMKSAERYLLMPEKKFIETYSAELDVRIQKLNIAFDLFIAEESHYKHNSYSGDPGPSSESPKSHPEFLSGAVMNLHRDGNSEESDGDEQSNNQGENEGNQEKVDQFSQTPSQTSSSQKQPFHRAQTPFSQQPRIDSSQSSHISPSPTLLFQKQSSHSAQTSFSQQSRISTTQPCPSQTPSSQKQRIDSGKPSHISSSSTPLSQKQSSRPTQTPSSHKKPSHSAQTPPSRQSRINTNQPSRSSQISSSQKQPSRSSQTPGSSSSRTPAQQKIIDQIEAGSNTWK